MNIGSSNNKSAISARLNTSKSWTCQVRWWWTSISMCKANWIRLSETEWCDNYYGLTHNYGRGTSQDGLTANGNAQDTTAQLTSAWIIMYRWGYRGTALQPKRIQTPNFWINRSLNDFINLCRTEVTDPYLVRPTSQNERGDTLFIE